MADRKISGLPNELTAVGAGDLLAIADVSASETKRLVAGTSITADTLGTVSQSGGVPTGAIIERGSNANGEFVRIADGTQICTHQLTASSGASVTWTFPSSFVGTSTLRVFNQPVNGAARIGSITIGSASSANFSSWTTGNARTADDCFLFAIGRWF